jgi:hypothetical protein
VLPGVSVVQCSTAAASAPVGTVGTVTDARGGTLDNLVPGQHDIAFTLVNFASVRQIEIVFPSRLDWTSSCTSRSART